VRQHSVCAADPRHNGREHSVCAVDFSHIGEAALSICCGS